MTDKTGALVLVRRSQLIELQAEVSDDASLAHERIRSILTAQPAGAVAEVVDVCGTGVKVPAWVGTGPAPDIPTGTKLYVGIPPAASVDVEGVGVREWIRNNMPQSYADDSVIEVLQALKAAGVEAEQDLIDSAGGAKGGRHE